MGIKFNSKKIANNLEKGIVQNAKQNLIKKIKEKFPEVEELNVEYSQSEQKFNITGKGISTEQINELLKD